MSTQPDIDIGEVLSRRRIAAAFATVSDPGAESEALRLDESERRAIATAIQQSTHHLGGFARTILDEWDQLEADEQVAGLLLFAEISRHPLSGRNRGLER